MRSKLIMALAFVAAPTFGSAQESEPQGQPAGAPESTEAQAPAPELDASRLAPATDTFDVVVQGNVIGSQITNIARGDEGFVYTETTTTPQAQQTTEVRLSEDLAMRSVRKTGTAGGQQISVDVTYADGRVRGTASIPSPQGVQENQIDAEVPERVIDDSVFMALLPTMPLTQGARFSLPVASAGAGRVLPITLTVTGEESLTVPAGTFGVYTLDMTGAAQAFELYVTKDTPHHLVKLGVQGAPIEFVLKGSTR